MGTQLIFCLETNKECKSDYIYIKKAIETFYDMDRTDIKLSPVFMKGKGNYLSKTVINDINKLIKHYHVGSMNNVSQVIYCFDCDNYDTKPEDDLFLKGAKKYCEEKGYYFVWFCRDIEMVFLGKSISDKEKKKSAVQFRKNNMIHSIKIEDLRAFKYQNKKSNLCNVLDEYLKEKQS